MNINNILNTPPNSPLNEDPTDLQSLLNSIEKKNISEVKNFLTYVKPTEEVVKALIINQFDETIIQQCLSKIDIVTPDFLQFIFIEYGAQISETLKKSCAVTASKELITEELLLNFLEKQISQEDFMYIIRSTDYRGVTAEILQKVVKNVFQKAYIKEIIDHSQENIITPKVFLTACEMTNVELIDYLLPKLNFQDFTEQDLEKIIQSSVLSQDCLESIERLLFSLPNSMLTEAVLYEYLICNTDPIKQYLFLQKAPASSLTGDFLHFLLQYDLSNFQVMELLRKAPKESLQYHVLLSLLDNYDRLKLSIDELKEVLKMAPKTSFNEPVLQAIIDRDCSDFFSCIDQEVLANAPESVQLYFLRKNMNQLGESIYLLLDTFPKVSERILILCTSQFGNDENILLNIFEKAPKENITEKVLINCIVKYTEMSSLKRNIILKNAPKKSLTHKVIRTMVLRNRYFNNQQLNDLVMHTSLSPEELNNILKLIIQTSKK